MRVKDNVSPQLIARFPDLRCNTRVSGGPSVTDVTWVIITNPSPIFIPAQGLLAAVRCHVGQKGNYERNTVNLVIQWHRYGAYIGQDMGHDAKKLVVEMSAATVVTKDHPMLFDQILSKNLVLTFRQRDVLLASHINQRRALADRKIPQLDDSTRLGLVMDFVVRPPTVFEQHLHVTANTKILVPVATHILQTGEADLATWPCPSWYSCFVTSLNCSLTSSIFRSLNRIELYGLTMYFLRIIFWTLVGSAIVFGSPPPEGSS